MLNEQQIVNNYEKYITLLKENTGDRFDNLKKLIKDFTEEHVALCPASPKKHYHGAYPGGLVHHLINVYNYANQLYDIWKFNNANMSGYTKQELLFSALVHDFGKLGTIGEPYYIKQTDDWRVKKLGEVYTYNPNIVHLRHSDRTLFLFQQYNIILSNNEYIGIHTHDGLFDVKNETYFNPMNKNQLFKNNLPFILHQADYMAYRIELENEQHNNFNRD